MTLLAGDVPSPAASVHRGRRRRLWVGGVSAAVLVAVAGWVAVGTHPAVGVGSFSGSGSGFYLASDGISSTRMVLKGDRGVLLVSVRNTGRVPFTVLGLAPRSPYSPLKSVGFQPDPYAPGKTVGDLNLPTQSQVSLAPGAEAGVVVQFTVDPCLFQAAGSYSEMPSVSLRVRQAGITTTQPLPLPLPVAIPGHSTAQNYPPTCPPVG